MIVYLNRSSTLHLKKEFGISSAGLYICGLIRSGLISREEAQRLIEENEDQVRLDENEESTGFSEYPIHRYKKSSLMTPKVIVPWLYY